MGENGSIKLNGENPGTKLDVQMTDEWIKSRARELLKNSASTQAQRDIASKILANLGTSNIVKTVTGVSSRGATIVKLQ